MAWLALATGCAVPIATASGPDAAGSDAGSDAGLPTRQVTPPVVPAATFAALSSGAAAHAELCVNDNLHPRFPDDADVFIRVFCADVDGGVVPQPRSLAELASALGLGFANRQGANGAGGNPGFTLLGGSSSLVARLVSSLNPRAILFTPATAGGAKPSGYVLLAYTRGDPFVEVAAHDPTLDRVVLYLVTFQQACASAPGGCAPGDLLLPAAEAGWTQVNSYTAATEINDTALDCFQCHQPSGPQGPTLLRMQEISPPFTHFFDAATVGGQSLLADFHAAHGTREDYAAIPAGMIDQSSPELLSALIAAAGFGAQPNAFDSAAIESEVRQSAPGQPGSNLPMGHSPTWNGIYALAQAGDAIAAPYHDVKNTDPNRLGAAGALYRSVASGQASAGELTDIRDVLLDEGLSDMGFAPAAGLDGGAMLVQMCQQCHNSRLDQTISRALFNVQNLAMLPQVRRQAAIDRLSITDPNDPRMMPPPLFRTLTEAERQAMISALGP